MKVMSGILHLSHRLYAKHLKRYRIFRWFATYIIARGYISLTEVHRSALKHASREYYESPDVAINAIKLVEVEGKFDLPGFHMGLPLLLEIDDKLALSPHINVLLPSLHPQHMSGGPNTALLLASLLAERGEKIRLISCGVSAQGEEFGLYDHMEGLIHRPVLRNNIQIVDAFGRGFKRCVGMNDIYFGTAWWTVQDIKYISNKSTYKTFIYLVQDFEALLHKASTLQARALETYSLQHIPIINTRLLYDHLVKHEIGKYGDTNFAENALIFEPALDKNSFFPVVKKDFLNKKVLLFYARPTTASRNLFEIGVAALRRAVDIGVIDKDNWEILAMGEDVPPIPLGRGVFLNPLPWMNFKGYAERVRTADLMLSLMLSPHPSYPPLEMAASGKLVVTNSFSVKSSGRLREYSPNIIVADSTLESISVALISAANRINVGIESPDPFGKINMPSSWDEALCDVVSELLNKLTRLRITHNPEMCSEGQPLYPLTKYEDYRKNRLSFRRSNTFYAQEQGLLSFITSAFNTAPEYLLELGQSFFVQDGGMSFEWLILDNASTSIETRAALEMLSQYPCVSLYRVEENLGIVGGMRYLLERASGLYILPMDSDDLIEPDCVHVVTKFIKENNYPAVMYTDEDKVLDGRYVYPYFKPDWDPVLFLHSCYIAHLCIINRNLALELGCYDDKNAEGCHDWDSFIRFMNAGYTPLHLPEVLYSWRLHNGSTSGNISSKNFISESHKNTLNKMLDSRGLSSLEVRNNPLFFHNVDWCFRSKQEVYGTQFSTVHIPYDGIDLREFQKLITKCSSEYVHIIWGGIIPDDDKWILEAIALLELFPSIVMIGGLFYRDGVIVDGPRIFGFGEGFDCPYIGRQISDPGYGANLFKAHSVSAVLIGHSLISRSFLMEKIPEMLIKDVPLSMLGLWLGGYAAEANRIVVYSPFMRAYCPPKFVGAISLNAHSMFLSRFWDLFPDNRFYSKRLSLRKHDAPMEWNAWGDQRDGHLSIVQRGMPSYQNWLEQSLPLRSKKYLLPKKPASISILTTIIETVNFKLLEELAETIVKQTTLPAEWVIVAHGSFSEAQVNYLKAKVGKWSVILKFELEPQGIIGAMKIALKVAQGDYVVPIDADDLLTYDALHILIASIDRMRFPDLLYSDEDLLINGKSANPYLRSSFDRVLNFDSSYIWHLCAIKRATAVKLDIYSDKGATWCHDWNTVIQLVNAGGSIEHVPEILYHWRQHSGSTTNNEKGNPDSLKSIRYILEKQIKNTSRPEHFYVTEWPINRGSPELYVARTDFDLPVFIGMDNITELTDELCSSSSILVFAAWGVQIRTKKVFLEVARLFELHPSLGSVGGLIVNQDAVIVDACWLANSKGELESPWIGQKVSYVGPYALAAKSQTVSLTGNKMAFYRASALVDFKLRTFYLGDLEASGHKLISKYLDDSGWDVGFSPLILGDVNIVKRFDSPNSIKTVHGTKAKNSALVHYGLTQNFFE